MTETEQTDKAQAMAVATTILQQLGGRQFLGMTGAKALTTVSEKLGGLSLKLPADAVRTFGPNGVNFVKVVLDWSDTYEVTFAKLSKGGTYEVVSFYENVYFDDLQDMFERETGLLVTLFERSR